MSAQFVDEFHPSNWIAFESHLQRVPDSCSWWCLPCQNTLVFRLHLLLKIGLPYLAALEMYSWQGSSVSLTATVCREAAM